MRRGKRGGEERESMPRGREGRENREGGVAEGE